MEAYGKILLIAMPVFLLLVLFEKWWGWRKGNDTVRNMDMISSLGSGVTNVTKDVLGLSLVVISYEWMVTNTGHRTYSVFFTGLYHCFFCARPGRLLDAPRTACSKFFLERPYRSP